MRRGALALAVVAMLVAGLAGCGGGTEPPESIVHRRPNLVVVVLDDLDQTSTPSWDALPKTKALVADRGMTFDNAFVTDPECCASQASLLTGMYPHNTNVYESTQGPDAFREGTSKQSIGVRLKAGGYTTAFIGKYLNGYEQQPSYVPPGWDEWFGLAGRNLLTGYSYGANHNGKMERFGRRPQDYQTDVLRRTANAFVDRVTQTPDHQPFLLSLFPSAPHSPIEPAPRDEDNEFTDDRLPPRKNANEADVTDKPTWLRAFPLLSRKEVAAQTSDYRRRLGSLLAVDDMVASVAAHLRQVDELDDTVFVFTSDNGYSFGSHRIIGKAAPYDEPARVAFAVAGPGIRHGDADQLVTNVDLAPTLYELAGVPLPDDVDGASIVPLLEGRNPSWRDDFMIEYRVGPNVALHTFDDVRRYVVRPGPKRRLVPDYRALRSSDWLYVEWYSGDEHELELYDMGKDPYQLTNLMADPASAASHQAVVGQLQARLTELASCSGLRCRD